MTATGNEIVRDLGRFLDRLLDPATTWPEKALYLQARGAGMRERLRFLCPDESEQVAASERLRRDLLVLLGGAVFHYGRSAFPGTGYPRLEIPNFRIQAMDPNRMAIVYTPKLIKQTFAPTWGMEVTVKEN